LIFQVLDQHRHSIVEANIRVFCYVHDRGDGNAHPYYRALKLVHPHPDDGGVLMLFSPTLIVHRIDSDSPLISAANLMGNNICLDECGLHHLLSTLYQLEHFEIVVEVNGTEVVLTAQVQVRWSYVLEEIEVLEPTTMVATPTVCFVHGRAHVNYKALADWDNEETEISVRQIERALDFVLR